MFDNLPRCRASSLAITVAWHKIDYDGLWSSDKLSRCGDEAQADYSWVYGIADAWGCFELSNLRVVLGRVAPIRKKLSLDRLQQDFNEYRTNGLCFIWEVAGKRYGYWTGCEVSCPQSLSEIATPGPHPCRQKSSSMRMSARSAA